ncbi:hypothetical protein HDU76_008609 [Blyttiomyces sp. JEL0837]|nr:hypothetical protein HDU76_008609 [Blyttiomyces sp. JEL0837]
MGDRDPLDKCIQKTSAVPVGDGETSVMDPPSMSQLTHSDDTLDNIPSYYSSTPRRPSVTDTLMWLTKLVHPNVAKLRITPEEQVQEKKTHSPSQSNLTGLGDGGGGKSENSLYRHVRKRVTCNIFRDFLLQIDTKVYAFADGELENAYSDWQHGILINSLRVGTIIITISSVAHALIDVATSLCAFTDYVGKDTTSTILQCYLMHGIFQFRSVVPCKLSHLALLMMVETGMVVIMAIVVPTTGMEALTMTQPDEQTPYLSKLIDKATRAFSPYVLPEAYAYLKKFRQHPLFLTFENRELEAQFWRYHNANRRLEWLYLELATALVIVPALTLWAYLTSLVNQPQYLMNIAFASQSVDVLLILIAVGINRLAWNQDKRYLHLANAVFLAAFVSINLFPTDYVLSYIAYTGPNFHSYVEPIWVLMLLTVLSPGGVQIELALMFVPVIGNFGVDFTSATLSDLVELRLKSLVLVEKSVSLTQAPSPGDKRVVPTNYSDSTSRHETLSELPTCDNTVAASDQPVSPSSVSTELHGYNNNLQTQISEIQVLHPNTAHSSWRDGRDDDVELSPRPKLSFWRRLNNRLNKMEEKIYVFPDPKLEAAFHNWLLHPLRNTFRAITISIWLTAIMHSFIDIVT